MLAALFRKTAGWAAGLILLAANSALGNDLAALGDVPFEQIFDYFATEVFERTDDEVRTFLLMTSFLPRMTVPLARKLTDNDRADQILSRLNRSNFFTERHATAESITYQYHPLFKEFLLQRAKSRVIGEEIIKIEKKAAMLLEADGQTDDAALLCIDVEDWNVLTELVLRHAGLLMAEGRFRTIEAWIDCIPPEIVERNGWLLYWKASCYITVQPPEARRLIERAYALFLAAQDPAGSFLCWAGIVNTYLYEWRDFQPLDRWIHEFQELHRIFNGFPSPEVEERATSSIFAAMMFRQPLHPDLPHWTDRVKINMQSTPDQSHRMFISYNLLLYYLWTSRFSEAGALVNLFAPVFKTSRGTPLPKLMWLRAVVLYYVYMADPDNGLETVKQGLQLAEETGVHYMDIMFHGAAIYHTAILGDFDLARRHLERMSSMRDQRGSNAEIYYASQSSLVALLQGDIETAVVQGELGVQLSEKAGVPLIINTNRAGLGFILSDAGQDAKLKPLISELRRGAAATGTAHIEAWCSILEAQVALRDENDAFFAERFSRAIDVSKKTGLRLFTWLPKTLTRMCTKALALNIETDFVKELIRLNKLIPDTSVSVPDSWPFPLKIRTLGKFELLLNDRPMVFGGKVQQKPLALLKAIISLGGRDVDDRSLTDALWPDAEGDLGRRSLDTTLHRLRKLLGDERVVQLQDGKVSLDERYCWVDTWTFERLLCTVEKNWAVLPKKPGGQKPETLLFAERANSLYRGHFLPSEDGETWALSMRERLRSKYMSSVGRLGKYHMDSGEFEKAVELFQRALEVDDLSEEFYQHLMLSYLKLGRKAEAATTYRRCSETLSRKLGFTPSARTEDIYRTIKA